MCQTAQEGGNYGDMWFICVGPQFPQRMSIQQSAMILLFSVLTTIWVAGAAITTYTSGMSPMVFKLGSQEPPMRLGLEGSQKTGWGSGFPLCFNQTCLLGFSGRTPSSRRAPEGATARWAVTVIQSFLRASEPWGLALAGAACGRLTAKSKSP